MHLDLLENAPRQRKQMVESPYPEDIVAQKSQGTLWPITSLPRKMEDPRDPKERDWGPDTTGDPAVYRKLA